ncbi:hypothetical protein CKALI_10490 [Corynebacterium kalinowskii]|uniref:Uncharacterized protein n=1 Tax=Corynebacterium kalinowskii TaxID=2675216 RepID=A0A6B8VIU6_9CORY|nr:hypothetical protein [Corynebacterium kalinowskii]QGU02949.1 hypothetical protein CKALI_10490 [Corynebacterium kalinowskii]
MTDVRERPETVSLTLTLWLWVVAGEMLHQVFNIIGGLLNTGELRSVARETMSEEQLKMLSEQQLTIIAGASVVFAGFIAMAVMGIVAWTARSFWKGQKGAENSRRFLTFFAAFFAMRGLFVFELATTGSVPLALALVDGITQLLVAVLAVLAALFGGKKESVEWARTTPSESP